MVKFGRHLKASASRVPEWSNQYIPYKDLKSILKQLRLMLDLDSSEPGECHAVAKCFLVDSANAFCVQDRAEEAPLLCTPQRNVYGSMMSPQRSVESRGSSAVNDLSRDHFIVKSCLLGDPIPEVELTDPAVVAAIDQFLELLSSSANRTHNFLVSTITAYENHFHDLVSQHHAVVKGRSTPSGPKMSTEAFLAAISYVHGLVLHLRGFMQVNELAISKIVKKYNKTIVCIRSSQDAAAAAVDEASPAPAPAQVQSPLYVNARDITRHWANASMMLTQLLAAMEAEFADTSGSNVTDAHAALTKIRSERSPFITFAAGAAVAFGCGLALCLAVLLLTHPSAQAFHDAFAPVAPVYRASVTPALLLVGWGCLVHLWRRSNLNWSYVMQASQITSLTADGFLMLGFLFLDLELLAVLICAILVVSRDCGPVVGMHSHLHAVLHADACGPPSFNINIIPYLVLAIAVVLLIHPIPRLYYAERKSFIRNVLMVLLQPVFVVFQGFRLNSNMFRYFFTADFVTSLTIFIADIFYSACFAFIGFNDTMGMCHPLVDQWKYCFTIYPFILRFFQCCCMYRATSARLHLINAGKYFSFVVVIISGFVYTMTQQVRWMLVAFSFVAEFYACGWDVAFDFGFVRGKSRVSSVNRHYGQSFYLLVMSLDIPLRFLFLITRTQGAIVPHVVSEPVATWSIFILEISRRFLWASLRVETECVANIEKYRSFDHVPDPLNDVQVATASIVDYVR